jgi:anti-anti-sigma regulatory factor
MISNHRDHAADALQVASSRIAEAQRTLTFILMDQVVDDATAPHVELTQDLMAKGHHYIVLCLEQLSFNDAQGLNVAISYAAAQERGDETVIGATRHALSRTQQLLQNVPPMTQEAELGGVTNSLSHALNSTTWALGHMYEAKIEETADVTS